MHEGENDSSAPRITKRKTVQETRRVAERAILIGVSLPPSVMRWAVDEHLSELESLAETAGVEVVEKMYQMRSRIDPALFIGKGKAEHLAQRVEEENIQLIIFDDDLSSVQTRNLERIVQRKVIDRTGLILDIFASRAVTREAQTQVELAQLEYLLPRLTRQWTHLSKQYGGIGTKGPGETQIETDRRLVRTRISHLKDRLEKIDQQRQTQRKSRKDMTRVALVGYTNVGKSTLMNLLSGSHVQVENKLFATLDSTVREVVLQNNLKILLSDTVGFIRKLPTHLVASFRSTLAEVVEADILLHVVDIAHPQFEDHIQSVEQTLRELHASGKPTIMVFNKIDALKERTIINRLQEQYPESVFISAIRNINVTSITKFIEKAISQSMREFDLTIRPADYKILSEVHQATEVLSSQFRPKAIHVRCKTDQHIIEQLMKRYGRHLSVA